MSRSPHPTSNLVNAPHSLRLNLKSRRTTYRALWTLRLFLKSFPANLPGVQIAVESQARKLPIHAQRTHWGSNRANKQREKNRLILSESLQTLFCPKFNKMESIASGTKTSVLKNSRSKPKIKMKFLFGAPSTVAEKKVSPVLTISPTTIQ